MDPKKAKRGSALGQQSPRRHDLLRSRHGQSRVAPAEGILCGHIGADGTRGLGDGMEREKEVLLVLDLFVGTAASQAAAV